MFVVSGAVIDAVVSEAINARALDVTTVAVNLSGDINVTSVLMSAAATIASNGQGFVDEITIFNNDEINHDVSVRYTSGAVSRELIDTIIPRGAALVYKPRIGWQVEGTAIGSGWVNSGMLGNASVTSGNIGSGQVGGFHIVSGGIQSGDLANQSVMSGSITPSIIADTHFSSGAKIDAAEVAVADGLLTAEMISGIKCVTVSVSGALVIAMAGQSGRFPAIGVCVDNAASGQVIRRYHKGRVYAQTIVKNNSGGIGTDYPLWLGISGELVVSNQIFGGSGLSQVVALATFQSGTIVDLTYASCASGFVARYSLGSGVVESGVIGSGQVGGPLFGSGSVTSAFIASGAISTYKIISGTTLTNVETLTEEFGSGDIHAVITEELISGGHPVNISQSGYARIAMSYVSGRMPAVGVLFTNVASGQPINIISGTPLVYQGIVTPAGGILPTSGFGSRLIVGKSGGFTLVLESGMVCQYIGTNYNSGMMHVRIDMNVTSGELGTFLGI